jgi:KDO2-lipid IV(A) lauroyltransferase
VEGVRRRLGIESIYPDDPPGKAIHLLRDKKIIGLLPDQDVFGAEGVFVDFMGRPAYTPLGPARLAWAARVPIYVAFCKRDDDGRFTIVANDPIFPDRSRPKAEELARLTQLWSRHVESFIMDHPEQWAWLHNRWKTTPEKLEAQGRARLTFETPA